MKKKKKEIILPTEEETEKFEMLSSLLDSNYKEMKEFSKKKPDGILNELKVRMVNKVLEQIKNILSTESTLEFLEILDNETLPSNSDTVLIIGQFKAAMEKYRNKYYYEDDIDSSLSSHHLFSSYSRWHTKENP
jgi:hypothetical protein